MDNRATIIIDCDENTVEIHTKPIELKDLEFPIRDNKAEIIAQLVSSKVHFLMNLKEDRLKKAMIEHLKDKGEL